MNENNNNNTKKESQQKKYKHSRRKPAMGAASAAAATPSASGSYKYSDDSIRKQKDNNMKPKNRNRGNVNGNGNGNGNGGVTVDIIKINPFLVSPTTKPEPIKNNHNVFLTNHRNQTSVQNVNIDERVKINYFIHNSSIQNDRRRSGGGGGGGGGGGSSGNVFKHGITTVDNRSKPDCGVIINTNDTEEFPTLGGSVKQSTNTTTNKVLNFKDVIMKQANTNTNTNTNTNEPTTSTTSTTSTASFRASDYSKPLPILSRGNIFLGAFYRNTDNDDDDNDDDDDNSNVGETIIKSTLVDSCDSSYDRLYK
jgi:hypothetical protein